MICKSFEVKICKLVVKSAKTTYQMWLLSEKCMLFLNLLKSYHLINAPLCHYRFLLFTVVTHNVIQRCSWYVQQWQLQNCICFQCIDSQILVFSLVLSLQRLSWTLWKYTLYMTLIKNNHYFSKKLSDFWISTFGDSKTGFKWFAHHPIFYMQHGSFSSKGLWTCIIA